MLRQFVKVITSSFLIVVLSASFGFAEDALRYDLNGDGVIKSEDVRALFNGFPDSLLGTPEAVQLLLSDVRTSLGTIIGDSNRDCLVDTGDLQHVFVSGLFDTGENATFSEGDFNGDNRFDTSDLVTLFQTGFYETGCIAFGPSCSEECLLGQNLPDISLEKEFLISGEDEIKLLQPNTNGPGISSELKSGEKLHFVYHFTDDDRDLVNYNVIIYDRETDTKFGAGFENLAPTGYLAVSFAFSIVNSQQDSLLAIVEVDGTEVFREVIPAHSFDISIDVGDSGGNVFGISKYLSVTEG